MVIDSVFAEIEAQIRVGVDNIKFELLLKASLRDKSLSSNEKINIEASLKRAYEFFINHSEKFFKKKFLQENLKLITSLFFVSNLPCSYRHYQAIVEIVTRLLSNPTLSPFKDDCLAEIENLKYFSTDLVGEVRD
jgi:hypothetical protein